MNVYFINTAMFTMLNLSRKDENIVKLLERFYEERVDEYLKR